MDARLRVLQRVAEAVRTVSRPDELVSTALEAMTGLTGAECSALHLLSPDGAWLDVHGERGFSQLGPVAERLSVSQGPLGSVATTGASLSLAKASADHGLLATSTPRRGARRERIHAFVCVPVSRGGRVLGTLTLGRRTPAPFEDDDVALVEAVAAHLAQALAAGGEAAATHEPGNLEHGWTQLRRAGRLAAIGDLAGSLAHEMNNPLTTIMGQAQLLSVRADVPEPVRERLGIVAAESARAAEVVQHLLRFAREYPPEPRLCSLAEQVNVVLEFAAHQLRHDRIRVVSEMGDCPPVLADESLLRQVLLALVQSARHAMVGAARERVLTIRTGRRDGRAYVEVLHTGEPPRAEPDVTLDPLRLIEAIPAGSEILAATRIVTDGGGRLSWSSPPGGGGALVVELPVDATPAS